MRRFIIAAALSAIEAPALSADDKDVARQAIVRFLNCQEQQALRSLSENYTKAKFLYVVNSVCNKEELEIRIIFIRLGATDKGRSLDEIRESVDDMLAGIKRNIANRYQAKLDEKAKR